MKKILSVVSVLLVAFVLVACGPQETYKIAMITDIGDVDDQSFNQGTWEGIVEYAEEHGISHKYYRPNEQTDEQYNSQIDIAVAGGAEIIITPGFLFAGPVATAQAKYPDVKFVILDAAPETVASNTLAVLFTETESAFYAGYAAVKDGFTELGFMGGLPFPSVVTFGIGFIAGAYKAADEMGLANFEFDPDYYTYVNGFGPTPEIKTKATSWYAAGVQVIHVAAGGAGASVWDAADDVAGKHVVGVDSNQAGFNSRVITSALKKVGEAAYQALDAFYSDEWDGGKTVRLSSVDGAVGLPTDASSWRFTTFTVAQYDAIFNQVVAGTVDVPDTVAQLYTFVSGLGYTLDPQFETAIPGTAS